MALAALCACSSDIELQPLDDTTGEDRRGMTPEEPAVNDPAMDRPVPAGQGGAPSAGEEGVTLPPLVSPAGSGGGPGTGSSGLGGGSASPDAAPTTDGSLGGGGGAPACPDADADGRCDTEDACPNVADDGTDHDADGIPDACDPCGIGVALGLSPLYYFPLDDTGESAAALNLGSALQNGTYVGPIERGWAGVADPQGRAARFLGEAGGEFSRVELLNAPVFPSTALTATFWVRTNQSGDYVVISYAVAGSSNEFAVIVERDRLIVTLQSSTFQALDIDRNRITDGTWHFVALSWDRTRAQYYFDGEAVGAPLITEAGFEIAESVAVPVSGPLALSPGGVLALGQDQDALGGGFSFEQAVVGGLDEVAIYDRVLSPEQIRAVFTATTCGERCDGVDNDGDGKLDEGFLGSSPACPAASCGLIAASSAFGPGDYFSSVTPEVPLTCLF
ncbi:MAG TPA: LamG-like jellyroll fold domain-containing protein [Polyangiaceae bacterium]|nr:LamG-like jellyroll fold domain-containing protein [Polyangiaceae bacterium]